MPSGRGLLCDGHRKAIGKSGLTPEQIAARRATGAASLIDAWGVGWAVGDPCVVGRVLADCDLTLLHASVSSQHARLERLDGVWRLVDLGSRNGTYVDGVQIEVAPLADGARLRFGEVDLYFVERAVASAASPAGPGRTAPSRRDQLVFTAAVTTPTGARVELAQRIEGGVVRVAGTRLELARLEFHLLQLLTEARRDAVTPELAYVPWTAMAERLEFRSRDADSENVRELVRRVRRKLEQAGLPELIESRHGVGYRLAAAPEVTR
ncbi:MAG: FHA domain-containing protein [Myxococcales bacterium]|nr:FHA domain-containing protein [Myxococcales bacterium]